MDVLKPMLSIIHKIKNPHQKELDKNVCLHIHMAFFFKFFFKKSANEAQLKISATS